MKDGIFSILSYYITFNIYFNVGSSGFVSPVNGEGPRVLRVKSEAEAKNLGNKFWVYHFIGRANKFGYFAEEHKVITDDGYILRVHRIPGSQENPKPTGKSVVFLQHGFFASSDTWIFPGPEKNLAYLLSDAGYDVWLGNNRGNTYSRAHKTLDPNNDPGFWEFSYTEMGIYDLPAVIDYILKETNQKSLVYIGHSMGTTTSYILLSERPEYNDKIKLLISLAPSAFFHEFAKGPDISFFIKHLSSNVENMLRAAKIYELLPQSTALAKLGKIFCSPESKFQKFCMIAIAQSSGSDPDQVDIDFLGELIGYFPAGASVQNVLHYVQNIKTGNFGFYDFGSFKNNQVYGQMTPPDYHLENIRAPTIFIYGKNDVLSNPKDVLTLASRFPKPPILEPVKYEKFNHADFIVAKNRQTLLYDRLLEVVAEGFNNVTTI